MTIIRSLIDTHSVDFEANRAAMAALVDELRMALADTRDGGRTEARERHEGRGKLFVRERVERLLDPDTPFLEFSALAAHGVYDEQVPAAGI
ncbi:MAG TPA: methylcrotonoyl-CoA carboxylase, partial [Roseiflexaceae bacterium]|nr:methylcrotonoyl-CoA carboxylase [Roseiflexaceae bacterium]